RASGYRHPARRVVHGPIRGAFTPWIVRGYDIDSDISGTETIEEAALAVSLSETNKAETKKGEAN
ncbi:MAG: hypothetical protein J2P52_07695, partial [Blastocatellia bacterium]|nr:hypothetical protein [Blastocatellia bacterium]